ncbi:DUF3857 and transglutaminase domain-containing protein [Cellvibrio sp. pealriver]|uniref:DUF3857 domain-containing transglutaminase family protein n=1 Tax=Cellvibrio sp. pealriver TaxID=1622269 RepID=UPI00066FC920|nr:DUF3857 and transglutaminase domain-containing protein [Cellvibrio sp. pealriver]
MSEFFFSRYLHVIAICSLLLAASSSHANAEDKKVHRIAPALKTLASSVDANKAGEAQVILRKTHVHIDEQLMSHATSYVAVYINSDEAVRDYSQISVSFNSFYEDIALEFANVRTPDGKIDSIKADATQIQSPTDENFYHDRKELLFSLPNVRKGSIIEFQYRYTDIKKMVPDQWFDSFSFHWWEDRAAGQGSRADAISISELQITAPKKIQLTSSDTNAFDQSRFPITQKRSTKGDQQTITWTGKNLAKIELQNNMPRTHDYAPYLRVSTTSKWNDVARWADALVEPHLISDEKLDALIAEIKKTALTHEQKTKAVYRAIQDRVRYVFAHVGRGGYEPHDAFEVLKNGYGDCKDQTVLAVMLLRKLGIKADPALIITRGRGVPDMRVPGVSFDHMIVHIPAQQGQPEIWMDTTGETSLYPGFSLGIEGQPALVVNSDTQTISTLPELNEREHLADLELVFDKFDGRNASASFKLQLGGMYEQRLRSMWQYSHERDKYFRELIGQIYNSAEVTELTASNADNMWQPFTIHGRFVFTNVWGGKKEPINYSFSITQLTNLFADLRNLHKPQDRKQPYAVDPGFTLRSRVVFNSPSPEHRLLLKTQGENIDNAYYRLVQTGSEEKNRYIVNQTFTAKTVQVPVADYADFYQKTNALQESNDWLLSYEYNKTSAELLALENSALNNNGKSDVASLIALAKLHIKNGDYKKSLDIAQQAVKASPKKAEAYYILGLAQGYNQLLTESDASFKTAEALGYQF